MKKRNLLVSLLSASTVILSASAGVSAAQTGIAKDLPSEKKTAILKTITTNVLTSDVTTSTKFNMTLKSSDLTQANKDMLPTSISFTSNIQYDKESSNAKGNFSFNMAMTGIKTPVNASASYQFEGIKNINSALFYLKFTNVQLPNELFNKDSTELGSSINMGISMIKNKWLKVDFAKLAKLDSTYKTSLNDYSKEINNILSGKVTVDSNAAALTQKLLDNATYSIDDTKTTLILNIPKNSPLIEQILSSTEFKNVLKDYNSKLSDDFSKATSASSDIAEINKAIASNELSLGDLSYKIELTNDNKYIHEALSIPLSFVDSQTTKTISGYKNVKKSNGYKTVKVNGKDTKQAIYKTVKQPIYRSVTKNTTYDLNISFDNTTSFADVTIDKLDATGAMDVIDLASGLLNTK